MPRILKDKTGLVSKRSEPSVVVLALLVALFTAGSVQSNLWLRVNGQVATVTFEAPPPRWNPAAYRVMSLGHFAILVDWVWIQALLDPALSRLGPNVRSTQYHRFDLVTELDPGNYWAYYSGGNLLVVVRDDAIGARDILIKGEEFRRKTLPSMPDEYRETHWKNSWKISVLLAYTYLFEFGDLPNAADAFKAGGQHPGAPPYLKSLGERLSRPGGEYEVGLRLLNFMLGGAKTDAEREKLLQQRAWLFVAQYLADLNRGFGEYLGKQSGYRSGVVLAEREMQRYLKGYFREAGVSQRDPWGGTLSLDTSGKIVTTTPFRKVFGLD